MNKFLLFIWLILLFAGAAQSCLPQGITFSTQNQIDSFPINYPNCTVIEGEVTIGTYGGSSIITNVIVVTTKKLNTTKWVVFLIF